MRPGIKKTAKHLPGCLFLFSNNSRADSPSRGTRSRTKGNKLPGNYLRGRPTGRNLRRGVKPPPQSANCSARARAKPRTEPWREPVWRVSVAHESATCPAGAPAHWPQADLNSVYTRLWTSTASAEMFSIISMFSMSMPSGKVRNSRYSSEMYCSASLLVQ